MKKEDKLPKVKVSRNGFRIRFEWRQIKKEVDWAETDRQRKDVYVEREVPICVGCDVESNAFICCGIKALSGMEWIKHVPVAKETLAQLIPCLRELTNGGNVAFVLSPQQRESGAAMLKLMGEVGHLTEQAFMNHNMQHNNYLYIWEFCGRHGAEVQPGFVKHRLHG